MVFIISHFIDMALADIPITEKLSIDGNMRYRIEVDGRDFNNDTGLLEYSCLRTQLGFKAQASDQVMIRIKFKESRYLGTTGSNMKSTSVIDLLEGYILVRNFIGLPVDLQLGRYEFLCGRRRIHGNGAWNNFGPRTFDGFRLLYKGQEIQCNFFYAKIVERGFTAQLPYTGDSFDLHDRNLFGLDGKLMNGEIQPLLVVDWDARKYVENPSLIITPAVYAKCKMCAVEFDLDLAYQFGTRNDKDLSSWIAAADINYSFKAKLKPTIGFGVDIASGTDAKDAAAGEDHTFYTPFMSRHTFKGYMDYYKDVTEGLIDAIFRIGISPGKDARLRLDIHNFSTMEDMVNADGGNYTQMGQEFDLRLKTSLAEGLGLDTAVCAFFATDDYKPNGDPSYFFYITLTGKF
ncbi:MAG: alginate export family protein [candidate division Zixibacteria bacterium]|nr:alginate export family protein [Candidatus Tariuqbacter arcticus]